MSIRPVKKVVQSKPTLEGAGVQLRRAFGFGNTTEFDPFLLLDDFRNDNPERLPRRLPVAPAPRHRDDHLRARGRGRARRQPRQQGHARRRRRAVDDGRAAASCTRRCRRAMRTAACTASSSGPTCPRSLKMTEPRYQDVKAKRHSRGHRRRRHQGARRLRRLLGQDGPGRRRRRRPELPRHLGAARQAEDASGRASTATPSPTSSPAPATFRDASEPFGVLTEKQVDWRGRSCCASRPATARSCCSTAATRSWCRRATRASASCSSPASRSRSRSPGTARS